MLQAGDDSPTFELPDQSGRLHRSSELDGWYLLYWYPKADTPGCTAQAEGLRDQIEAFDDLGCRVLGASFDDPEANRRFRHKYKLNFALLSDETHRAALAFGAVTDLSEAHASRVAHLISPEGTVAVSYVVDDPGFFAEQVLDDLERLQGAASADRLS